MDGIIMTKIANVAYHRRSNADDSHALRALQKIMDERHAGKNWSALYEHTGNHSVVWAVGNG